ncbi:hypothetical protein MMC18_004430 [Xylographa bjoerkii]|nr:hypothetical protein [Xylographa bjoerkii]
MERNTGDGLAGLHSSKSSLRLEQIADLRARGIGDHIDLPQLVVCGDQSAGKSSVLEGMTGLPFPRNDGVCTKFATEIILQHSVGELAIVATILPSSSRSNTSKTALGTYRRRLRNFRELPVAIEEVGKLMGVRGYGNITEGPAFSQDVLRIQVDGPTGLHLTVVDLPGLISVANEEQTEEDVKMVQNLVDSYVANPRTIILAVVQASNDIANQGIIQKSRRFDKPGRRTVGIITKPDLINVGTEKRIALLAKNQDTTKLKLGYFLVKNPTPSELENGITPDQRQKNEMMYFQSTPWKEQTLSPDRVGIVQLRTFLQNLLDQHIERELPKVREELRKLMTRTEQEITILGHERPTIGHLRMYLSGLAMRFHGLTTSALNGTYHEVDSTFFGANDADSHSKRLRAVVHRHNSAFSDYMRDNGQRRKLVTSHADSDSVSDMSSEDSPMLVTEAEMKEWVREIYSNSRGKELPGNYNHVLLSELFHIQSGRWRDIAENHLTTIYDEIAEFVVSALSHITKDEGVQTELSDIILVSLQKNRQAAEAELRKLCEDEEQQPITYNHYYTDNVQKARQDSTRKLIRKAMNDATAQDWNGKLHVSNNTVDAEKLLASLQSRIVVNMDGQACAEALAGLQAYYKVALKTFVDNVTRQVIERHLLTTLHAVFCPETVASFGEDVLTRIAAESPGDVTKRKQLRDLYDNLAKSLQRLHR